jgi:hypothetical protein
MSVASLNQSGIIVLDDVVELHAIAPRTNPEPESKEFEA